MKKFLISLSVLTMLVFTFSYISFADTAGNNTKKATNAVGNVLSGAANGTQNVVNNAKNAVENGANNVKNVASDIGNDVKETGNDVVGAMTGRNDNTYTAERTATDTQAFGMSTTSWTWIILGIVGAAIVGLVWYYGSQYEHRNYDND